MPLKTLNPNLKLGTAIQAHPLTFNSDYRRIASSEFNLLIPENEMKCHWVCKHPHTINEGSGDYPDAGDDPVVPVPVVKEYQRNGKFSLTRLAPKGGKLQVQVEVDGPLADYMEVVNPQSATPGNGVYTFEDGEEFVLDWQLKPREKIVGLPPLSELSEDQLFGSKVKITASETLANGSRKTVKQDAYLYRWLEVVGATDPELSTGKTAAFHEKLNGGLGKFVKEKKVGLHLPVSVPTTFKGERSEFQYGGEFVGSQTAKWNFQKELPVAQKKDFWDVVRINANKVLLGEVKVEGQPLSAAELERLINDFEIAKKSLSKIMDEFFKGERDALSQGGDTLKEFCRKAFDLLRQRLEIVMQRYYDLLRDKWDLYHTRRVGKFSWEGHQERFEVERDFLENILNFIYKNCPDMYRDINNSDILQNAENAVSLPVPDEPSNQMTRSEIIETIQRLGGNFVNGIIQVSKNISNALWTLFLFLGGLLLMPLRQVQ